MRISERHLQLDLSQIKIPEGNIDEGGVVIEKHSQMIVFDKDHPLPPYAVRNNDQVKWE